MKLLSAISLLCLFATTPVQARRYPPHGYPCLGCAPCPGNPTEFCDTTGGSSFSQRENTAELNREGYYVKNGRIVPIPKRSERVE